MYSNLQISFFINSLDVFETSKNFCNFFSSLFFCYRKILIVVSNLKKYINLMKIIELGKINIKFIETLVSRENSYE